MSNGNNRARRFALYCSAIMAMGLFAFVGVLEGGGAASRSSGAAAGRFRWLSLPTTSSSSGSSSQNDDEEEVNKANLRQQTKAGGSNSSSKAGQSSRGKKGNNNKKSTQQKQQQTALVNGSSVNGSSHNSAEENGAATIINQASRRQNATVVVATASSSPPLNLTAAPTNDEENPTESKARLPDSASTKEGAASAKNNSRTATHSSPPPQDVSSTITTSSDDEEPAEKETTAATLQQPDNGSDQQNPPDADEKQTAAETESPHKNLNILFIGDTVMRYQYLDLVYYLKYGHWTNNGTSPFALRTLGDPKYCETSNAPLRPQEKIDCFYDTDPETGLPLTDFVENRFYHDPHNNIFVSFVGRFGGFYSHVRCPPTAVQFIDESNPCWTAPVPNGIAASYRLFKDMIPDYIAELEPRPDFVVYNEGLWDGHGLDIRMRQVKIHNAFLELGIKGIYKTTTSTPSSVLPAKEDPAREHDINMCATLEYCFDMSWTDALTGPEARWPDGIHFRDSVNHVINMRFLSFLDGLLRVEPPRYERQAAALQALTPVIPFGMDQRPRNLHIVFIGDSITRYQYLDFAYYLKHGEWPSSSNFTSFHIRLTKNELADSFMDVSNQALSPEEHCDCHYSPFTEGLESFHENRYFFDHERNNSVAYIGQLGRLGSRGHWDPQTVHWSNHSLPDHFEPFNWEHASMAELLRHHIGHLSIKPDYILLNEGLWTNHSLMTPESLVEVRNALQEIGIPGIYKTTTHDSGHFRSERLTTSPHDEYLCRELSFCFNVSFTNEYSSPSWKWDTIHFVDRVNEAINARFLRYLQERYRKDHGVEIYNDDEGTIVNPAR